MRRLVFAGVLALPFLVTAPASAAQPRIYHTITASLAQAEVSRTVGCVQMDAIVSSTVAMYAGQPGPVNKQGFTDVFVRVTDACSVTAAAGGGPVIAEYEGSAAVPLRVDPRLRRASVSAAMQDRDTSVPISVTVSWTGVGDLEHTTSHIHELFRGEGVVSSSANDLRRQAVATLSLHVGDVVALQDVEAGNAFMEQTKARCIEVPRPGVEGFFPCFGIPG